eukprot:9520039-Alexandrium_andersonii.AAC.1
MHALRSVAWHATLSTLAAPLPTGWSKMPCAATAASTASAHADNNGPINGGSLTQALTADVTLSRK